MASAQPELSAFLAGHWPDARRLWFASLPGVLGVFAIAWGGPLRTPGVVLVAAAAFYAGATMWQRRRLRRANALDFAESLAIAEDFAAWVATWPSGSARASAAPSAGASGNGAVGAMVGASVRSTARAAAGASVSGEAAATTRARTGMSASDPSSLDPALHRGLRLCGLEKNVRPQMVAAIDTWLRYAMGAGGHRGGTPVADGRVAAGTPAGAATALGSPTGESFVAVFEEFGGQGLGCTLYAIAPGSWWCMGCVGNVAREIAAPFVAGTHVYRTLVTTATARARSFPFATGRAFPRLDAMLGGSVEGVPEVDVVGAPVGPGMILAGSFRFSGEDDPLQVFPFDILQELFQIAGKYSPVFRVSPVYGSVRPRLEILRSK